MGNIIMLLPNKRQKRIMKLINNRGVSRLKNKDVGRFSVVVFPKSIGGSEQWCEN